MESKHIADRVRLVKKAREDLKAEFNYGSAYFSPTIKRQISEVMDSLSQLEYIFKDWFNEESSREARNKEGF